MSFLPLRRFKKSTEKAPQRTKTAQRTTKISGKKRVFDNRKNGFLVLQEDWVMIQIEDWVRSFFYKHF
jgi:hypothetical protein